MWLSADQWGIVAGFVTIASAGTVTGPDPSSFAGYGAWAVAFVLLLVTFKDVIIKALSKNGSVPVAGDSDARVAASLERTSLILSQMEVNLRRSMDDIQDTQKDHGKALNDIDYRTKDIREKVSALHNQANG